MDSSGNFVWAKSFSGLGGDTPQTIYLDSNDNIYTSGRFAETVDFDPGENTYNLTSNGFDDVFISKLDSSGNFVWAKAFGGAENDTSYDMYIYNDEYVYVVGVCKSASVDFDPGESTHNITSTGDFDSFLLKLFMADTTPTSFSFTDSTEVELDTSVESNEIIVGGLGRATDISISSCTSTECMYSINSGAYTNTPSTVVNGNTVKVKQVSSSQYQTSTNLTLTIGDTSDTYTITTKAAPQARTGTTRVFREKFLAQQAKAQTETITTPTNTTPTSPSLNITRTLKHKMSGDDVKELQSYLNTHGYPVSLSGSGSLNNETTYFGLLTKKAVIKFQKVNNLIPDGIVGPLTRGKMK